MRSANLALTMKCYLQKQNSQTNFLPNMWTLMSYRRSSILTSVQGHLESSLISALLLHVQPVNDHIDGSYCRQNGITVSNVPAYANRTVAEHVFALLLAISHKVPEAVERTRKGVFTQVGLQGFDLDGKTLGVIGTGSIGKAVIEIARGFRMEVIAYDIKPDEKAASLLGYHYATMDELLASADIISLHVPGNRRTRHLISTAALSQMKMGAVLINTSRGQVVDIQALLHALVTRKIAAAGLDVLPEEPTIREESELLRSIFAKEHNLETLLADQILHHLPNVIVTPHSIGSTDEIWVNKWEENVSQVASIIKGEAPEALVNRDVWNQPIFQAKLKRFQEVITSEDTTHR